MSSLRKTTFFFEKMPLSGLWFFCFCLFFVVTDIAHSDSVSVTVSTVPRSSFDFTNSTAVINTRLGYIHAPLQVTGWQSSITGANQSTNFSVGDGRHGEFTTTTYSQFSTGGDISGQIIRIDTDTYSDLQFTYFNLASGWTIRPTGSRPLIIRSLSDMDIDGTISCTGENGDSAQGDATVQAYGGTGRCGGGNGGDGGTVAIPAGQNGYPRTGLVTGGVGGSRTSGATGGDSGGGGGAYTSGAAAAGSKPSGGTGSGAGVSYRDDGFSANLNGAGAGGGGGGVFDQAPFSNGAGGGAGGGSIQLYAVRNINVNTTASIVANGGNGGSGGGLKGGAGGAGAGGSILIFAGTGAFMNGSAVVQASRGTVGTTAVGSGGTAAPKGRTWFMDPGGEHQGATNEDPVTTITTLGNIAFQTGTFQAITTAFDLSGTLAQFTSITSTASNLSGGSSEFYLGSSDSADGANALASSSLTVASAITAGQSLSRYAKIRLDITNTSATTPLQVTGFNLNYTRGNLSDFQFKGGCGLVRPVGASSTLSPDGTDFDLRWSRLFFCLALILPVFLWQFLRVRIL